MRRREVDLGDAGHELNLIPYLDVMVNLVLFMLMSITSFLSFTVLNASIPQISPDSAQAAAQVKKKELLLMVRVTTNGFEIDPSIRGGKKLARQKLTKTTEDEFPYEQLTEQSKVLKSQFQEETKVLIIAQQNISYDTIIQTMDALRDLEEDGDELLFPDVTLSVL